MKNLMLFMLLFVAAGCASKKEYYADGQMKREAYGILFSEGKSFTLISVGGK